MDPRSISRDKSKHTNFPSAFKSQTEIPIPSLPKELEKDQQNYFSYDTDAAPPPPLSTTNFIANEKCNSSPHLIRSSMYTIPADPHLYSNINLPIYITLQPFSHKQEYNEGDVPISCSECLCYVNPFTTIEYEKNIFICNVCQAKNKISEEIKKTYATTEYTIKKVIEDKKTIEQINTRESRINDENIDFQTKLIYSNITSNSDVNLMVDSSYFDKKLFATSFIFAVHKNSLFTQSLNEIRKLVTNESFVEQYKKISLIVIGDEIEIYKKRNVDDGSNKNNNDEISKNNNVGDSKNNNVGDSKNCGVCIEIDVLCDSLSFLTPSYFLCNESIIHAIDHALQKNETKNENFSIEDVLNVFVGLSKFCIGSKGALFVEHKFNVTKDTYIQRFNENNHSFYIFGKNICGLEEIAMQTSGDVYKNVKDIKHLSSRSFFGVKISLKTSDAIRKSNIYANTCLENNIEIKMSSMDSQSIATFSFYVDETCKEGQSIYVQAMITYFNCFGDEKLLVLNQCLTSSFKAGNIYSDISFDTLFSGLCKSMVQDYENIQKNIASTKKSIAKCLKHYRTYVCKSANDNQLVLCESMKLVPLLFSSFIKNNLFNTDFDYVTIKKLINLPVDRNLRFFYPRIFSLSDYFLEKRIFQIQNTYKNIQSNEIYVIENGMQIFLYIGKDVEIEESQLFEGEEGTILIDLFDEIQNEYDLQMDYKIIRQGKGDFEVLSMFVEDKLNNVASYNDFICDLHFMIKDM